MTLVHLAGFTMETRLIGGPGTGERKQAQADMKLNVLTIRIRPSTTLFVVRLTSFTSDGSGTTESVLSRIGVTSSGTTIVRSKWSQFNYHCTVLVGAQGLGDSG